MPAAAAVAAAPASQRIRLADVGIGGLPAVRRGHMDLVLSLNVVGMEAVGHGAALAVGHHAQAVGAAGERTARALSGQGEDHRRSGDGLMVLILHLNDGLARGALADVVDRAVAFDDHDIQFGRGVLGVHNGRGGNGNQ